MRRMSIGEVIALAFVFFTLALLTISLLSTPRTSAVQRGRWCYIAPDGTMDLHNCITPVGTEQQ